MGISVILYLAFLATYFGWTQFSLLGGICLGFNSLTPFRRKIIGKRARMTAKFYIKYFGWTKNFVDITNTHRKLCSKNGKRLYPQKRSLLSYQAIVDFIFEKGYSENEGWTYM